MAFSKGKSGNPAGRPKAATLEEIRALARRAAPEMVEILIAVARTSESATAKTAAASAVLDRGYGKPAIVAGDEDGAATSWVALIQAARSRSNG
jgi:hypothetical protein